MSQENDDHKKIRLFLETSRERLRLLSEEDLILIIPPDIASLVDLLKRTWGHADYILHNVIVAVPNRHKII